MAQSVSRTLLYHIFVALSFFLSKTNGQGAVPFPVDRIKEVKFNGGVAGASTFYTSDWLPDEAFRFNQPEGQGWHSGPHEGPSQTLPVMIWYDFKSSGVQPAEVSFQPAQSGNTLQKAPSSYQFVGSNDSVCDLYATWTILCEDLSDREWRSINEIKYCKVKSEIREKFRCLGLRVLNNRYGDGWVALRNIRMWEKIDSAGRVEL